VTTNAQQVTEDTHIWQSMWSCQLSVTRKYIVNSRQRYRRRRRRRRHHHRICAMPITKRRQVHYNVSSSK